MGAAEREPFARSRVYRETYCTSDRPTKWRVPRRPTGPFSFPFPLLDPRPHVVERVDIASTRVRTKTSLLFVVFFIIFTLIRSLGKRRTDIRCVSYGRASVAIGRSKVRRSADLRSIKPMYMYLYVFIDLTLGNSSDSDWKRISQPAARY